MPEFVNVPAKIYGFSFLSPENAAWLAVRTLTMSACYGCDFQTLYLGCLSMQARDSDNTGVNSKLFRTSYRMTDREMEQLVRFATGQIQSHGSEWKSDVLQLTRIFEKMAVGKMSKTKALEHLQQESQRAAKLLRNEGKTELAQLLFQGKGARTLGEIWVKYEAVLPYIFAESLRSLIKIKETSGEVKLEDLTHMPTIFLEQMAKVSNSRPLKFDTLYRIVFE